MWIRRTFKFRSNGIITQSKGIYKRSQAFRQGGTVRIRRRDSSNSITECCKCFGTMMLLVPVLFSLIAVSDGDWSSVYKTVTFNFRKILRPPNMTIVNTTFTVDTRRKCAYECTERRSYSFYYSKSTYICHCNHGRDSNTGSVPGAEEIIYGEAESLQEDFEDGSKKKSYRWPLEKDCLQLYQKGATDDGVYTIQPVGGATVDTWCDMTNGGWTVFQRRQDGSENFFRNWNDYVTGFGDKCGEYWLGLEHIHLLTKEHSELNISLKAFENSTQSFAYASYSTFAIGNSSTNYTLAVGDFEGNCGDSFSTHSGRMFSTVDSDNDESVLNVNCAQKYYGAWWYKACHESNLNGLYLEGHNYYFGKGVVWSRCWGQYYSLKETQMKVRRLELP